MQTFKHYQVLTGIPNADIYQQLLDYAKSKGVPIHGTTIASDYKAWPNLSFINGKIDSNSGVNGHTVITFEQFFQYCDNWIKCQPVTVTLNDNYTAKIEGNTANVGCQTFEFEAIERLYNAMKKTP